MSEEPDPKSNRRRQRRRLLQRTRGGLGLGAAAIGLAACSGAAGSASSSTVPRSPTAGGASAGPVRAAGLGGAVTTYEVPPSATAPGLGSPSAPDLAALDPAVRSNGELFVFLPGTGGSPDCCLQLLETAARTGFLAVGLTYENTEAVGRICRNDLSCYGTVRQDDFDGSTPSQYADIRPSDSIQSRLADLLSYLAANHPTEGWDGFLAGSVPLWSRIVVAGHSQGGGDSAYIAKIRSVEGVVMLSSDVDSSVTSPPMAATYLTTGHLTPLDRYVGLAHTADPFYDKITTDWSALGLPSLGAGASVDGRRPPFGNSHQLVTSAAVPPGRVPSLAAHDSTAVDEQTPSCADGSPAFAPVWRYMMEVAGGLRVTGGGPVCTA